MSDDQEPTAVSHSAPSHYAFGSIEQVDEVTHALGWATEYRQLEAGNFSSTISTREGGSWFVMQEQSSLSIEAEAPAPVGMFVLALVEGEPAVVNGQAVSADHVFVQCPDAEFRATLPAGINVTQIALAAEQFEQARLALAPELSLEPSATDAIAVAPGRLADIRQAMRAVLVNPGLREAAREEAAAAIVAELITVAADHQGASPGRSLHRAAARCALARAREYIEAHLGEAIRVSSICRYAQTNLRSLDRIFTRELGMSPQQYIKARRLNAVRRRLLVTDTEEGSSVTEVALNCGFVHLGRFAGDYRRYFGESPRQTLQCTSVVAEV